MNAAQVLQLIRDTAPVYGYRKVDPLLVLAQAALETGNFTSTIYHENRNAFGMRLATVRPTLATGTNRAHATYRTVADSVADYFDRQRAFGIPDTANARAYVDATVRSGYAEAPRYAEAWMNKYLNLSGNAPEPSALGMGMAGATFIAIGYALHKWN